MEWISVTEKLPEYSGKKIVAYPSDASRVTIAYYTDLDGEFYNLSTKNPIKHVSFWMPLPEPPKQ